MQKYTDRLGKLIRELERKDKLPVYLEQEFIKLGKEAYNYLEQAIRQKKLTGRQTKNALHILNILAPNLGECYGRNRLLELVIELADSENIEARSKAALIIIGISLLNEAYQSLKIPLATRPIATQALEKILKRGVSSANLTEYINDFIKGNIQFGTQSNIIEQ